MRGVAVLSAAAASWVLVTGAFPRLAIRPPRIPVPYAIGAAAAFVVAGSVALSALGVPVIALAIACLAATVPITLGQQRESAKHSRTRDAWPDVLAYTRTSISAGATLEDAFLAALQRNEAIDPEYAEFVRKEVGFGGGFSPGLDAIRVSHADPTTDRIAISLSAASGSGGSRVGQVVGVLAASVADEIRLRKAHDAALTEQRWTVNVALVAPWVLLALSVATNPQAKAAYSTAEGAVVVGVGLVCTVAGWLLARRAARLSSAPRVFR